MNANNRNERKKFVLALLNHSIKPYTSREVADLCSVSSMKTTLKRYCQQGLLKRKRENKKNNTPYKYSITSKGIERLEYLIGDNSIKSQIELLVREPIREIKLLEREQIKNIEKILKI